jgi:Na+-driven multidrug efflux pump
MNFGILLIQGLVNSFGLVTMSAFAAAVKIDSFAYMPVQDFGNAYSTFVAQNKGAGLEERIRKGTKSAVIVAALFCFLISTIVFNFADTLMLIFIKPEQTEIILKGAEYLRIEGACYLGIGLLFLLYGYYRGVGKPGISVVLTIVSLGTRVLLSYALAPTLGEHMIWWSIPIGWFLADAIGVVQGIRKEKWFSRKRAEDEKVFND